jgi:hypothetical protein
VDDELDLETQAMSYGNIKERKDVTSNEKQEEAETQGYGYDNVGTAANASASAAAQPKQKKDATSITFGGGRPMFSRKVNKGKFGAEFSEGLDDIDDDGNIKNKSKKDQSKAEGGQREFINLGSKARVGGRPEEEFKAESRPAAVKPTFKGKLNLNRGNQEQEGDFGVKTTYDFKVSYVSSTPGEQRERKPKDKGVPFERHMAEARADDDEGFEVVKGHNERKQRVLKRADSSDSNEGEGQSDGTKITRGDTRGQRGGRGGFFKNSSKRD